jgi:hypothetical protein
MDYCSTSLLNQYLTMKAVKSKSKCITHCDMCNGKVDDANHIYPITEILYGEIIGLMVCSDCNELHQRELEWNIDRQLKQ